MAFAQVVSSEDRENEEHGQEAVNRFFSVPIFALLGLALPWEGWIDLGWGGVLLAAAVLLLRRSPVLLPLRPLLPAVRSTPEALFIGWFGRAGVSDTGLAQVVETPVGAMPLGSFIGLWVLNAHCHAGEISALKGLKGLQGYPA